jgi:hypothetical protein
LLDDRRFLFHHWWFGIRDRLFGRNRRLAGVDLVILRANRCGRQQQCRDQHQREQPSHELA